MRMSDPIRDIAGRLPCAAEFFEVAGRFAFVFTPVERPSSGSLPWMWYAPTLQRYHPREGNTWMFQQFLEHGMAIAGVDVGESYGNPQGRKLYSALYNALRRAHGASERAVLLPQSRGGLMLYNWATENPRCVACIAGIFPVCDMRSYPGLETACGAYGMSKDELAAALAEHNPVERLAPLAEAGVPIMHVHGDNDAPVPLGPNSGELAQRYRELGGRMELLVVPGKGHETIPEFFQCQRLVEFVLAHVRPEEA